MSRKKMDKVDEQGTALEWDVPVESASAETELVKKKRGRPKKAALVKPKAPPKDTRVSWNVFFAWAIKMHPTQVKVEHYRAMKTFLASKNHAMLDTRAGFIETFRSYGLDLS